MEKNIWKNRIKHFCLFLIIMTILVLCIFFKGAWAKGIYLITIQGFRDTNRRVSFYGESEEDKKFIDSIVENVGSSMMYYSYIKEKNINDKLVVYDPNVRRLSEKKVFKTEEDKNIKKEAAAQGKNKEVKENGEEKEKTKNDAEKAEEVAEASAITSEKLKRMGIGQLYTMEQLNDYNFLLNNFYVVTERAEVLPEELKADELLAMDMSIKTDNTKPQILIYHTHSMEGFADSVEGDINTSIVAVGARLAELLSDKYGYNVIHCTERFDYRDGVLDRGKAYTYARESLLQILDDNPSIQVVLDIHRDGVGEDVHLDTEVDGKNMSQIMFFNGVSRAREGGDIDYLYNKYKKSNLAFSLQLKLLAEKKYPGYTRHNYIDAYQYNLDLRERSSLIEVGAQNNTFEQELNAMEPLAALLNSVLCNSDEI